MSKVQISGFQRWLDERTREANRESQILKTRVGPVQYTSVGKGPVVLHSHGSPAGCDIGRYMFGHLTRVGFCVLTPSRPGFLETPLSVGRSIEAQADMFAAFLDALSIDQVVLHAWSGGGPPGLAFARQYPDRCAGYIHYCAVSHRWNHRITWFEKALMSDRPLYWIDKLAQRFPETFRRKAAAELGVNYLAIRDDPEQLAELDRFFEMIAPPSLRNAGSFNDIENYRGLSKFPFAEIKVPTLVVFSKDDPQLPYSHGEQVAFSVRNAKFLSLESGGHIPHIGPQRQQVIESIVQFIESCLSRGSQTFPKD